MSDTTPVPEVATVTLTNTNSQGGVFLPELGRDLLAGHFVEVAHEIGQKLLDELGHFGIARVEHPSADPEPAPPVESAAAVPSAAVEPATQPEAAPAAGE